MRKFILTITILLLSVLILGCGDSDYGNESQDGNIPPTPSMGKKPSGFKKSGKITITGLTEPYYDPQNVEGKFGDELTWTNNDSLPHTVTADDGSFHSGSLKRGGTYKRKMDKKGDISYHCELHPQMKARLRVK